VTARRRGDDRLVYSSERGGRVPGDAAPAPRRPRGDGVARVRREVKGRRGKTVTTIEGIDLADDGLRALAKDLKQLCGTGGSVSDGVIVIQGDHRDVIVSALEGRGYTVKLAGG